MEAITNIAAAFVAAQAEIQTAVKDAKNPHLGNKYADFASVWGAVQPALVKNGLAVYQPVVPFHDGVGVQTTLIHKSGETLDMGIVPVIVEGSKGVNASQAQGLAITYARRYGLSSAMCVCTEDDDGNQGGPPRQYEQRPAQSRDAAQPAARTSPPARQPAPATAATAQPAKSAADLAIDAVCAWLREMYGDNRADAETWLSTQGYETFDAFYMTDVNNTRRVWTACQSAVRKFREDGDPFADM